MKTDLKRERSAPFVAAQRAGFATGRASYPKPCPFCGETADLLVTSTAVWCGTCGASGPGPVPHHGQKIAWNTRAGAED